jgi:hypothetical protein
MVREMKRFSFESPITIIIACLIFCRTSCVVLNYESFIRSSYVEFVLPLHKLTS